MASFGARSFFICLSGVALVTLAACTDVDDVIPPPPKNGGAADAARDTATGDGASPVVDASDGGEPDSALDAGSQPRPDASDAGPG